MIDKITEGFNLVFRWMGIWLACNLVTGVIGWCHHGVGQATYSRPK